MVQQFCGSSAGARIQTRTELQRPLQENLLWGGARRYFRRSAGQVQVGVVPRWASRPEQASMEA